MLRALQCGISIKDMDLLTIGDITDMRTESANDDYEYPYKAEQSDFDRF